MTKTNILIVEDDAITAKILAAFLTKMDYTVVDIADSGQMAIDLVNKKEIDLILMDINLNDNMTGLDAALHIKTHFTVVIIFLTSYSDNETLQKAKICEPYSFILKPFNEAELRANIEMAIYQHHQKKEIQKSTQNLLHLYSKRQ